MARETAQNFDLTNKSEEAAKKQELFKLCADPVENQKQIAEIGGLLEDDIKALFSLGTLDHATALATDAGRELAATLGPNVLLSTRDQFFVEQLADRYTANFGEIIYYTRERDGVLGVISASINDGGAAMATNPLLTEKGYRTPIQVVPNRLVMTFEYDDPRLAESQASSRSKAVEFARYRIRKAMQDLLVTSWLAGQYTDGNPFPAAIKYDMPVGRTHPTNNTIDVSGSGGKLDLDCVRKFSDYFDNLGMTGQKVLFVSPAMWNQIKTWASTTTRTDTGAVFADKVLNLGGADTIQVFDVLVVKKWQVPDNAGWGLVLADGSGSKTFGVYQFGGIQTVPSLNVKPTRAAFDVYIPGIAAVNHNPVATAFVKFA